MSEPVGYLLTWRTYGTWLHGDARGSVDWEHNVFGTSMLAPSALRGEHVRARMGHPPVLLTPEAQARVTPVIGEHCRIRGWELCEEAVRSNHVHVVVTNVGVDPDLMMSQFKAYATRALRQSGLMPPDAPVWAEGGSTQYLWNARELDHACAYVREGQDLPR